MLSDSYAACEVLAREHYENFPVASLLLPRRMRPHVAAVYAFARVADDFADEGDRSPDERQRLLDGWLEQLRQASGGASGALTDESPIPDPRSPIPAPQVFEALGHTIRVCGLPLPLFEDLLSAFRQDITTHRYVSWHDLLDYCRRSANPVGRLVLRIAGHDDPALDRASDALCTALQLTNFWQDLARDWRRGRLYVPAEDCDQCGACEADLDAGRITPAWTCALARACRRTRALFVAGRPVCDGVGGRLKLELRATWLGGIAILDRVEAAGYDVFTRRPALTRADVPLLLWRALLWRRTPHTGGQRAVGSGQRTREPGDPGTGEPTDLRSPTPDPRPPIPE